jgi:hypothetical protein
LLTWTCSNAYRQPIRIWDLDEGMDMYVGPSRSGTILEVGVVLADDGTSTIVHAMVARPKYL